MPLPRSTLASILPVIVALAVFVMAYQSPQPVMVEAGSTQSDKFLDNFNDAERGSRWSQARSAIWLTGLGGGNLAWTAGIRLSGSRPEGVPAPHVLLRVNGQLVSQFDASNDERDYSVRVPAGSLGLNGDLVLEIDSDTFIPPNDPRTLGLRVIRAWATPDSGFALPSLKVFAFALAFGLVLAYLTTKAFSASGNAVTSDVRKNALTDARDVRAFARTTIIAISFTFALVLATLLVLLAPSRAEFTWWLSPFALAALGAVILTATFARIVPRSLLGAQGWRAWLALLVLAALVRLWLDTGRGYEGDVAIYLSLAWKTVTFGLQTSYLDVGSVPPPNTPPFLLYPFWALGWLYQQLFSPLFPPTWLNDPPILRFMLRLPALVADLLAAALIVCVTASRGTKLALTAAVFYLFNPALIFDSAYWGQTAALHTLWMLLAVLGASLASFGWAGAALALAALTKPQALAVAPLVLVLAWRERGLLRLISAGAFIWLLVDLPFIVSGNTQSVLLQYVQTAQYHPYIAVNAHNVWWFVTQGLGWQPDTLLLGPFTVRLWGLILFGVAALLAAVSVWRDPTRLYQAAAFLSAAFFMLLTQIHENHILPMFAPLAIAVVLDRRLWWLYAAFALTALTNMALHDPNFVLALGFPADDIYGGTALAWPRWLNAVIQTALFVFFAWMLIHRMLKLNRENANPSERSERRWEGK